MSNLVLPRNLGPFFWIFPDKTPVGFWWTSNLNFNNKYDENRPIFSISRKWGDGYIYRVPTSANFCLAINLLLVYLNEVRLYYSQSSTYYFFEKIWPKKAKNFSNGHNLAIFQSILILIEDLKSSENLEYFTLWKKIDTPLFEKVIMILKIFDKLYWVCKKYQFHINLHFSKYVNFTNIQWIFILIEYLESS